MLNKSSIWEFFSNLNFETGDKVVESLTLNPKPMGRRLEFIQKMGPSLKNQTTLQLSDFSKGSLFFHASSLMRFPKC